ncbi:hypothetical protein QDR37_09980 [Amnibacterium sp. CER49]|uniref:hypothetical protein n=1 Tax=Amnibacterium sp. CER49 TaxID=3039161 RepID=UPI002449406A|nr:hypothetical protein [Amnibacterium sp. CER49]MDH2444272.1 hypothetical protein [Amnibacterium sp. CER49]
MSTAERPATAPARLRRLPRRSWLHALVAFVVGALLGEMMQYALVALLFGVWPVALVTLLLATAAFGVLGAALHRRRFGWLLLLTPALWLPVAVAAPYLAAAAHHGELDLASPLPAVLPGAAAALVALLSWARRRD